MANLNPGRLRAAVELLALEIQRCGVRISDAKISSQSKKVLEQKRELELKLSSADRRLSHHLIQGVCRDLGSLDQVLGLFLKTPAEQLDYEVRTCLRMGIFELVSSRTPEHANTY